MSVKTFDILCVLSENETSSATGMSATGVEIEGVNIGDKSYVCAIDVSNLVGTVDGSNYFDLGFSACATSGGTYVEIGFAVASTVGEKQIGFTAAQLEATVPGARFFKSTATLFGTTNTDITATTYLSVI